MRTTPVDHQLAINGQADLAQTGGLVAAFARYFDSLVHGAVGGPYLPGRDGKVSQILIGFGTAVTIMDTKRRLG